jgi:hypothetical protein
MNNSKKYTVTVSTILLLSLITVLFLIVGTLFIYKNKAVFGIVFIIYGLFMFVTQIIQRIYIQDNKLIIQGLFIKKIDIIRIQGITKRAMKRNKGITIRYLDDSGIEIETSIYPVKDFKNLISEIHSVNGSVGIE